jgi:hypothetical protein
MSCLVEEFITFMLSDSLEVSSLRACLLYLALICTATLGMASAAGFNEVLIVDAAIPPWTGDVVRLGGTGSSLEIWMSALDRDGNAVSDLNEENFRATAIMSPEGFYGNNLSVFVPGLVPGEESLQIYDLHIAPEGNTTWSEGGYVLLLEVNAGRQMGRVMVPLVVAKASPADALGSTASSPSPES